MTESLIPKLDAPIVLVHGLCGYDRITAFGRTLRDYFPGIREKLEAAGNRVLVPRLSCTLGVAARANELKNFIAQRVPGGPVHVVGHSMGGLDARFMVSRLGMADRVRSLTTVGTPHRGTAFADWCIRRFGRLVGPFFQLLGLSYQAFLDLTTAGCRRFNESVPDAPGVRVLLGRGRVRKPVDGGRSGALPHGIVSRAEGPNDGVVSVASAAWGEHNDVWDGDHLNLVNWPNRHARKRGVWESFAPDYGRIVRRIADAE